MTTLGAFEAAEGVGRQRRHGAAFVPQFSPEQGLSRYSLGSIIATSEASSVRFGVVAGAAQFARLLAVKQLNPAVSRQLSRVSRFKEEMRIHARVRHPNIVELVDAVEFGGESWLVMEYLDGATLGTILLHRRASGQPLEPELATGIIAPLLRGLHAVHESKDDAGLSLGIVHGAVCPRHVMVDRDGQVKLLDFGMAKAIGESPALGPRRGPGRYGHLSPELVLGDNVDRRSDLFSTGILLWEALAGRSLFEDSAVSDAEGLRRVLRSPIPALRSVRAGLPRRLSAIVSKALQRDPARRFATAEEFALALESAVAPTSPPRLAALVTSLGAPHFEPSREALAAVRHSLPPPLTQPQFSEAPDVEEETALALTGRFQADSLSPANAEATAPRLSPLRPLAVALGAAALAASLVVAFRTHPGRPTVRAVTNSAAVAAAAPETHPNSLALPHTGPVSGLVEPVVIDATPVSPLPARQDDEPSPAPRPPVGVLRRPQSSARGGAAAPRAAACSPPTFLGEDGIHHFKAQCL